MRTVDLRQREVINIISAERIGYVADVELDAKTGLIDSVIIPKRVGLFSKRQEFSIPWEKIVSIGRDIILVELTEAEVVR